MSKINNILWIVIPAAAGALTAGDSWAQGGAAYQFVERDLGGRPFALACQLSSPKTWPTHSGVRIGFDYQDDDNQRFVLVMAGRASLHEVVQGQTKRIGTMGLLPEGPFRLTLRRSTWDVAAYGNGRLLCEARVDVSANGRAGIAATPGGPKCELEAVQPVEPLYFGDSFMRTPDEDNPWQPVTGSWAETGQRDPEVTPAHSANPFMYRAFGEGKNPLLSIAGAWYWRDYSLEAAVRAVSARAVGICSYLQDDQNYFLFRWTTAAGAEDDGQIIRVSAGRPTVLARARGGFLPGQWYRIGLRVSGGVVQALIDGQVVCQAQDNWFGQGKIGLYAEGEGTCALFDDIVVEPWKALDGNLWTTEVGGWQDHGASWQTDARAKARSKTSAGEGCTVVGAPDWDNLSVSATLRRAGDAAAGVCAAWQDERNYVVLRWVGDRVELARLHDGAADILASAPAGVPSSRPAQLLLRSDDRYWQGFVDGRLVAEAVDFLPTAGKVGLYGRGNGVVGSEFAVSFRDRSSLSHAVGEEPKLPELFEDDQVMLSWATKAAEWKPLAGLSPSSPTSSFVPVVHRHEGELYEDPSLTFPTPDTKNAWQMTAAIRASGADLTSGYMLALEGKGDGKIGWQMTRNGMPVKADGVGELKLDGPALITLEQRGRFVVVRQDGQPFVVFTDPQPLRGTQVRLTPSAQGIDWTTVSVGCRGLVDEKFTAAPMAWWAHSGVWDVTQRWTCSPQWSFFGGHSALAPMLWSKQSFGGDFVVEGYLATPMDAVRSERSPADMNVTVCGNGADPSTGYTLVYAGWGKTKNALYRNGVKVAESRFVAPSEADKNYHQDWFHIRIERWGRKLLVYVEGALLFEYEDPNPLPGGAVGFWTYNGGIQLARVRVWYERPGPTEYAAKVAELRRKALRELRPMPAPEDLDQLSNDFEKSLGDFGAASTLDGAVVSLDDTVALKGKRCLKVWNATSGGYFTLRAVRHPFSAEKFPRLSFAYRIPPNVRVDLYAKVDGQWHRVCFLGSPVAPIPTGSSAPRPLTAATLAAAREAAAKAAGQPKELGTIPDVKADGAWHTASFDLLAALQQAGVANLTVEELAFAAPDIEARMGLDANPMGATYWLDEFQLTPAS